MNQTVNPSVKNGKRDMAMVALGIVLGVVVLGMMMTINPWTISTAAGSGQSVQELTVEVADETAVAEHLQTGPGRPAVMFYEPAAPVYEDWQPYSHLGVPGLEPFTVEQSTGCMQPYPHSGIPCLELNGNHTIEAKPEAAETSNRNFTLDLEYAAKYQQ